MFKSSFIIGSSLSALVIVFAMAAAQPAAAQTAANVVCSGCVGSGDILNNDIRSRDIRNGQVKTADLANRAVTGAKVRNGSLTAIDLGDEAGVEFSEGAQSDSLAAGVHTVIRSIKVTAPRRGFVILHASGEFSFFNFGFVECSLTTGTTVEVFDAQTAGIAQDVDLDQFFGMTEGFVVPRGTTTFNLVCREIAGGVIVQNTDLTALYAPTRY